MDIAALAMTMSQINIQNDVGTAVLSKAIDTNESMGKQIVNMIDRSAMEVSVNPNIGSNIDISC
ncbi:MAG: YjfB family protein [Lachnospiraceae bacterium]|nr:YjfB family protein [Lachnospiraceae bacterium]MBO7599692.1 YjfB family protein [Lachnospiraceae bacterium]